MLGCQARGPAVSEIPTISTALPWQRELWLQLHKQMNEQKLPHAILLSGVPYSGKAALALALARLLLCHQPEAGNNCGHCHACELSKSGSHGDFRWLQPEAPSRVIKVDQVRQLVEFTGKTASLGRRKVIVISPAEAMNTAAANALLKALEEPSADTFIILVCHRPAGLPATIRSRCQAQKLAMPGAQASLAWLASLTGDAGDAEQSLDLARGQVLLAARIYRDASLDSAAAVRQAVNALGSGSGTVADLAGLMADEPLESLLAQLHDFLARRLLKMDAPQLAGKLARSLYGLVDEVVRLQRVVYSGANPNRQLLVDALSARFQMVLT